MGGVLKGNRLFLRCLHTHVSTDSETGAEDSQSPESEKIVILYS